MNRAIDYPIHVNTDRHHLHWETTLDRLELDVILAERKLDDPTAPDLEPWDEPNLAGPVPLDLVDRALAILARQRAVEARLAATAQGLRRHQDFASRVDRATARGAQPVYLDMEA
ncbi:hypothetical protein [Nocardioides aquiterrae]|uniref:Uncharacterized protein n=1 Tax=Nocardioides aquiterrae TaxID=203799 RepID=A0ABN1UCT2_9ACTN